jgi:hypothetical protein
MPTAEPRPVSPTDDEPVEAQLEALRRESLQRTAELRAIAAQLPAVVGRRAMIRTFLGDNRANPNKAEIARRGASKAGRSVRGAMRDVARRVRPAR